MDYFIGDSTLLPPECDGHFREVIWRLPRLWIGYRGDTSLPESNWAPSPDQTIWLGSFNNLAKVREETLALWARVMNVIPHSRLLLKDRRISSRSTRQRILGELQRYGIREDRVEFAAPVSDWQAHMTMYDRVDIALDPVPLNSGTTAFDALWMGVPIAGIEGNWMGARLTSTLLRALGRPEWVARDEDHYVTIVAELARDVGGRMALRKSQRALMANSQLCDAVGLARTLEDAFVRMFVQGAQKRTDGSVIAEGRIAHGSRAC
jgi:predicted O-linked N-acetylglucosamine transferase (SPINDLY family)